MYEVPRSADARGLPSFRSAALTWALWVGGSVGGAMVAFMLLESYFSDLEDLTSSKLLGYAIGFGLIGLLSGVPQWLVMRRMVRQARWWVLVSVIAWALTGVTGEAVDEVDGPALILAMAVAALVSGVGQWAIVREQYRRGGWLIVGNVVGMILGLGSGAVADELVRRDHIHLLLLRIDQGVLLWSIGWLVASMVTGLALVRVLWARRSVAPEMAAAAAGSAFSAAAASVPEVPGGAAEAGGDPQALDGAHVANDMRPTPESSSEPIAPQPPSQGAEAGS